MYKSEYLTVRVDQGRGRVSAHGDHRPTAVAGDVLRFERGWYSGTHKFFMQNYHSLYSRVLMYALVEDDVGMGSAFTASDA